MPFAEQTTPTDASLPAAHPCAKCGAPVDEGDRFCNACGDEQPQATVVVTDAAQRHLRCQNCGAEMTVDPNQRSYVCPFCESTYVIEFAAEETNRQRPEFVIGFAITPEKAAEKFRTWLHTGGWFHPGDLKTAQIVSRLTGIYLPFWSFSMLARSQWTSSIGEYWYRTETYTVTVNGKRQTRTRQVREVEWWPLSGSHHRYYSGYLVSGSRGLKQNEAESVYPFQLPALKRFDPSYLAGWPSEEYSVERDEALAICQQKFCDVERENVAGFMPGDTHRSLTLQTQFEHVNSDLILLPVYLLRYRYRDATYLFLINGQTGRIAGKKPYSSRRIAVAVGAAIVAVLVIVGLCYWLAGR